MNVPIDGMLESVSEAIKKGIGRKNLVAIVAIVILSTMTESPLNLCFLVAGIATSAIITQFFLDVYEVKKTGKDQVDNGHSNVTDMETPNEEVVPPAA